MKNKIILFLSRIQSCFAGKEKKLRGLSSRGTLYIRGHKTHAFMAWMEFGRSVFRFWKPRASARGASFLLCGLCAIGCATFSQAGEWYRISVDDIRQNRPYFAILNLKNILKQYPDSPYAPKAAFAIGEYYYDNADYFNAINTFSDYIRRYPDDKGAVFAKLILYKMIIDFKKDDRKNQYQENLIKEIRKELFAEPLFLIFYDKKSPRSYRSIFSNSYLVYDYVDKIKVFRNDKDFIELTP